MITSTRARYHSAKPSPLTADQRARMAAAVARHDARIATAARKARLARLAYVCASIALSVAVFYSAT
jgi:hypothetical protein